MSNLGLLHLKTVYSTPSTGPSYFTCRTRLSLSWLSWDEIDFRRYPFLSFRLLEPTRDRQLPSYRPSVPGLLFLVELTVLIMQKWNMTISSFCNNFQKTRPREGTGWNISSETRKRFLRYLTYLDFLDRSTLLVWSEVCSKKVNDRHTETSSEIRHLRPQRRTIITFPLSIYYGSTKLNDSNLIYSTVCRPVPRSSNQWCSEKLSPLLHEEGHKMTLNKDVDIMNSALQMYRQRK